MKVTDSKHRLLELMQIYDLTQQDIADKTGIDKSAISMYVNGKREPRQDKISLISEAYNLDPAWIMGHDVPMERRNSSQTAEEHFEFLHKFTRLSKRDQSIIISVMDSMLKESQ